MSTNSGDKPKTNSSCEHVNTNESHATLHKVIWQSKGLSLSAKVLQLIHIVYLLVCPRVYYGGFQGWILAYLSSLFVFSFCNNRTCKNVQKQLLLLLDKVKKSEQYYFAFPFLIPCLFDGFQQAHTATRVIRTKMPPVEMMMYRELLSVNIQSVS